MWRGGVKLLRAAGTLALAGAAALIALPMAVDYRLDTRLGRARRDLAEFASAYQRYYADTGHWPCTWDERWTGQRPVGDLHCLRAGDLQAPGWKGPYLQGERLSERPPRPGSHGHGDLVDPWGRSYIALYHPSSKRHGAEGGFIGLLSRGPDGRQHTALAHALHGQRRGDDILHVVTRQVR
jgi:hypothetical protein